MAITPLPTAPSRATPSDFSVKADAFVAALPVFVTEANAQAAALTLAATTANSTTSLAIGTGAKSLTVDVSKSYQPGMSVKIARTASPSNWMHGDVTSYNSGTGALVVAVTNILGSGTFTDWTVTFSAPMAAGLAITAGKTLTVSENVNLDEAVAMSSKAPKADPVFTGTVTIPIGYTLTGATASLAVNETSPVIFTTVNTPSMYLVSVCGNNGYWTGVWLINSSGNVTVISSLYKTNADCLLEDNPGAGDTDVFLKNIHVSLAMVLHWSCLRIL